MVTEEQRKIILHLMNLGHLREDEVIQKLKDELGIEISKADLRAATSWLKNQRGI